MKMYKACVIVLFLSAMGVSQGCVGRAIGEGIEKALGPTAYVLPMEPRWPEKDSQYLAAYENFELAPLKSEFLPTPTEFMTVFPERFDDQMISKGLPIGKRGKTLLIRVTILAYQPVSSYQKALGPTEEVVARVELTDKESGKPVGKAICIGRTYQSIGLGPQWKAWGLARAIADKWINKYYPEQGRHETKEQAPPSE